MFLTVSRMIIQQRWPHGTQGTGAHVSFWTEFVFLPLTQKKTPVSSPLCLPTPLSPAPRSFWVSDPCRVLATNPCPLYCLLQPPHQHQWCWAHSCHLSTVSTRSPILCARYLLQGKLRLVTQNWYFCWNNQPPSSVQMQISEAL